jgi:hypothetical protein
MSSGFSSSLSGRLLQQHPKQPPSEIEANLVDLGLLGSKTARKKTTRPEHKTKPKVVEFGSPVVQHSTYTRPCL